MNPLPRPEVWRAAARLHAEGIDRGFLAQLGPRFLTQMYRAIDESERGILLTEEVDGRVVGFVAGSVGGGAFHRRMLRHPIALALSLASVLYRPDLWPRLLETVRHARSTLDTNGLPPAELLSLSVDARLRRRGIAEKLYRSLQARFTEAGVAGFTILVGDELASARQFYVKMGAQAHAAATLHRGTGSTIFVQPATAVPNIPEESRCR